MRLIIALAAILLMPFASAREQNHTCQGGHNCNDNGGGDTTVRSNNTAVAGAISGSTSGAMAEGGSSTVGDTTATALTGDASASTEVVNNLSIFGNGGGEGGSSGVDGQPAGGDILSPSTSVTTTTTNEYKEAPRAYAGHAAAPKDIDCRTILGFDFRGATDDGAGGATFGIPLRERKDCKYERQAARAFAKGDLERGWANHCMSPTNLEVTIMVAHVVHDVELDTNGAFKRCMLNAKVEDPTPPKT